MTVNEIYELTLSVMDEAADASYTVRVLPLLRALRRDIASAAGVKEELPPLSGMSSKFGFGDDVCENTAVYGLAAELLIESFPQKAAFCLAKYEEGLRRLWNCKFEYLDADDDWYRLTVGG